MIQDLLTLVILLGILSFLVFVHELGHFLAAKLVGVHPKEFAIGFGKAIFKKKYKGTEYRINMIPLGGYVSLEGEDDASKKHGFRAKPFPAKFIILIGGVFMNLIFGIIFLGIFLLQSDFIIPYQGRTDFSFRNTEKVVKENIYVAYDIDQDFWPNLEESDLLVSINNQKFENIDDVNTLLSNAKDNVSFEVIDINTLETKKFESQISPQLSQSTMLKVTFVEEGSAADGNIERFDIIKSVNNKNFTNFEDFKEILDNNAGKEVSIQIIREGEDQKIAVELGNGEDNTSVLGVAAPEYYGFFVGSFTQAPNGKEYPTYLVKYKENIISPFAFTYDTTVYQFKYLKTLVDESFENNDFKEVSEAFGSPVAVGDTVNTIVESEVFELLPYLTGLISLSLAIFNILPVPALDGGQIAVSLFETVRRKRLSDETLGKINLAGFIVLITFSLAIISKDLFQFGIISGIGDFFQNIFG